MDLREMDLRENEQMSGTGTGSGSKNNLFLNAIFHKSIGEGVQGSKARTHL